MVNKPSRRELRFLYPHLKLETLLEILDILNYESMVGQDEIDAAVQTLKEENERAAIAVMEFEAKVRRRFEAISASMLHHGLELGVALPRSADLEHVQAILTYGFAAPSSAQTFVGGNYLPSAYVRHNVENKLGSRFNIARYDAALAYLRRAGVVIESKKGVAGAELLSLNIKERAREVSAIGAAIIRAVKAFMYRHRSKK